MTEQKIVYIEGIFAVQRPHHHRRMRPHRLRLHGEVPTKPGKIARGRRIAIACSDKTHAFTTFTLAEFTGDLVIGLPPCTSTSTSCTHFPPSFDNPICRDLGSTWPCACTATPLGTSCTRLTTWFSRTLAGGAGGPPSAGRPSASAFTTWRHDNEGSTETDSEGMHLWFGGRCQWPAVRGAALRQRVALRLHRCVVTI